MTTPDFNDDKNRQTRFIQPKFAALPETEQL